VNAGKSYQAGGLQGVYRVLHAYPISHTRRRGDFALLDRKSSMRSMRLPENNRFMRGLRSWVGFRQIGRAHERGPDRMFGRSTLRFGGTSTRAQGHSFLLLFAARPHHVVGLGIVSMSFLGAIAQVIWRFAHPERVPTGFTTVIIIVLFLAAYSALPLGHRLLHFAHL